MAFLKVTVLVAAVLAFASAHPQYEAPAAPPSNSYGSPDEGASSPASYSFSYDNSDPDSGNFYGHAEKREGPNSSGEYRVLLPDGRTQVVQYTVDGDGGYIAKISYEQGSAAGGGGGYGAPPAPSGGGGGGYQ